MTRDALDYPGNEPGLIAYEWPSCSYVTSVLDLPEADERPKALVVMRAIALAAVEEVAARAPCRCLGGDALDNWRGTPREHFPCSPRCPTNASRSPHRRPGLEEPAGASYTSLGSAAVAEDGLAVALDVLVPSQTIE
jgi:hypothetical protein